MNNLKLNDVCEFIVDCLHSTAITQEEGYPLIRTPNIGKGRFNLDNVFRVSKNTYLKQTSRATPRVDDLIFAREAPAGNIAIIKDIEPVCLGQRTVHLRVNKSKIDPDYLCYYLLSPYQQGRLLSTATGATVKHINMKDIRQLSLKNIHLLSAQKKIAKILSNYDDLIENNLKRIKLLEESARLTYEEWFLRFRIDGEKLEIDSETGLPFGWEEKEITAIATVNKKSITARTAPEYIKYIDISSTKTGYHKPPDIMNFTDAPSRARRVVEYGDTIFSTVRPNRKTYSLILENDPILIASTGFAVVSPNVNETFPFIYFSLSSQNFIDSAVAVAGGAAYPAINQTDFEKLKIVVPTKDILDKFSKQTSPILKTKSNFLNQNKLLKEARDILLPRLMTGIIDVEKMDGI